MDSWQEPKRVTRDVRAYCRLCALTMLIKKGEEWKCKACGYEDYIDEVEAEDKDV